MPLRSVTHSPWPLRPPSGHRRPDLEGTPVVNRFWASARIFVAAAVVFGALAASPAHPATAATHPEEGEQDVVLNPDPVDNTPHVLDGGTEAVIDLGSLGEARRISRRAEPMSSASTTYSRRTPPRSHSMRSPAASVVSRIMLTVGTGGRPVA